VANGDCFGAGRRLVSASAHLKRASIITRVPSASTVCVWRPVSLLALHPTHPSVQPATLPSCWTAVSVRDAAMFHGTALEAHITYIQRSLVVASRYRGIFLQVANTLVLTLLPLRATHTHPAPPTNRQFAELLDRLEATRLHKEEKDEDALGGGGAVAKGLRRKLGLRKGWHQRPEVSMELQLEVELPPGQMHPLCDGQDPKSCLPHTHRHFWTLLHVERHMPRLANDKWQVLRDMEDLRRQAAVAVEILKVFKQGALILDEVSHKH
jgi:hypothetical protein